MIEQARVSAKLSQEEMAEKLSIKRSTYQYWEKVTPGMDKIKAVAKALGLPDDYFFVKQDEPAVGNIPKLGDEPPPIKILSPEQIMSVLAVAYQGQVEIIRTQTSILEIIKKEMATREGQKDISANLNEALADIEKISLVQDRSEKALNYLTELATRKNPPSKGVGKRAHEIDGDEQKLGKKHG